MSLIKLLILLLLLIAIILSPFLIYYALSNKKYKCDKGVCTKSFSGKYKTLTDCETDCIKYSCVKNECVKDKNGPHTINDCHKICKSSQEATDEYSSSMYGVLVKYADISVNVVDNKIKGKLNVYNNGLPFIFKNPDLVNILSKVATTPKPNSDVYMDGQLLISLGDSTSRVNIELNKTYNTITVTNSMNPGQYLITEDI